VRKGKLVADEKPTVPAEQAPETKKSEVLLAITSGADHFRLPTGNEVENEDGSKSPEFVEVHTYPSVVANRTLAKKVIDTADGLGVKISEVKVES
jgi:hypothetical protein